jgi:hypothetical protein
MSSDLIEVCEKLLRDAGSRKVMLCSAEGEVLAHAGSTGALEDSNTDAVAQLIADVIQQSAKVGQIPGADDIVVTLKSTLQACAAPVGALAAVVVLFDGSTTLERVRTKMRRARTVLEKSLAAQPANADNKNPRDPS